MLQTILYVFATLLATILAAVYLTKKWAWSYWKRRGIESYEPQRFMDIGAQYYQSYYYFKKRGIKLGGTYLFLHPHYVPTDLDLIKQILIGDFDHFVNRGLFEYKDTKEPMDAHLFNLEDDQWKNLRNKLSPTFTSGKIKMMFQTLVDTTAGLEGVLQEYADSKVPFEMKDVMARFTTDVIGSVAFGIECNSLKNPDSDFRKFGRVVMDNMDLKTVMAFMFSSLPKIVQKIFQRVFKKQIRKARSEQFDTHEFFRSIVKQTVAYREKNDVFRNDFLHLLLLLKNKGTVDGPNVSSIKAENGSVGNLTQDEINAQCFLFFIAGFETTSTATSFALFELARYPEIQEKLRKEIHKALAENKGKITYDMIMNMSYLDMVVNETIRIHSIRTLTRVCRKDFPVPGTNHIIKKNEMVMVPVEAIHNDPDLYPEPDIFNPERFSTEKRAAMHTAQFMPFGDGPRMCIGSRFAQVQVKVGLTCIINKFRVSLNSKTKLPLELMKSFLSTSAVEGIWLDIERI